MARRLAASSCNASQLSACLVTVFTICAPDVVARPSILRLYCLCHPAAAVKSSPMSEVGSQVWHETFSQLFRPPLPKIHRGIKSAIFFISSRLSVATVSKRSRLSYSFIVDKKLDTVYSDGDR